MNLESLKLEDLDRLTIRRGSHPAPNGKVEACAMEAGFLRWAMRQGWDKSRIVSEWSDSMPCTCPVIGGFVRSWNDGISDDSVRTRLFSPGVLDMLPGTKGGDALMMRRMWMAIDWNIRMQTPAFLRLAQLEACAVALEALPEIRSLEALSNARAAWEDAHKHGAAAWVAAWAAAGAVAGVAAGDAARAAAWPAARAAAGDAARAAAGAAAGARLRPTVEAMLVSAADLLKRMCEAK